MNQKKIESRLATKLGISLKEADKILNACIESLKDEITELEAGKYFNIRGFGTFTKLAKPTRAGRNPKTGAPLQIAARNAIKFKLSKEMNEVIK